VAEGPPKDIAKSKRSYTGQVLKEAGVTMGGYSGSRHHALDRDCSCLLLTVSRVLL